MKLKELQDAMIAAMKAKDKFRKDAISALVSAVKKKGIDNGCRDNIPDEMANEAILKEIKSVKEQIDTCPADRTELLEEYKKRYEIMSEFAPKMLSAEEVKAILEEKFSDVLATKNKGQCSRSKFLTKLLKTFDKTFREIFPVFISTKRREKPSAFLTIIL